MIWHTLLENGASNVFECKQEEEEMKKARLLIPPKPSSVGGGLLFHVSESLRSLYDASHVRLVLPWYAFAPSHPSVTPRSSARPITTLTIFTASRACRTHGNKSNFAIHTAHCLSLPVDQRLEHPSDDHSSLKLLSKATYTGCTKTATAFDSAQPFQLQIAHLHSTPLSTDKGRFL